MKSKAPVLSAFLAMLSFCPTMIVAENAAPESARIAFDSAISAVERRDYALLAYIIDQQPEALTYRTGLGDDLFHEFRYIVHQDTGNPAIDLRAIETLLDHGIAPSVSNGLLGSLLSEANNFGSQIEELPIENGECLENRSTFFPVIDRLIEAGAEFGKLPIPIEGLEPTEAFFYQYQMCFSAFVCGGSYERPSKNVRQQISVATTSKEKNFLLRLVSGGSHDLGCLVELNDW